MVQELLEKTLEALGVLSCGGQETWASMFADVKAMWAALSVGKSWAQPPACFMGGLHPVPIAENPYYFSLSLFFKVTCYEHSCEYRVLSLKGGVGGRWW